MIDVWTEKYRPDTLDEIVGQEKIVEFELDKRAFAYYNTEIEDWYVESGDYEILIGSSSRDIRLKNSVKVDSSLELPEKYSINTTVGDLMADPEKKELFNELLNNYLAGQDLMEMLGGENREMMEALLKYMPLRSLVMFSGGAVNRAQVEEIVAKLNES
mgnify:CR=1 FL=1